MKDKWRNASQVDDIRKPPIHRFSRHNAFPNGEAKRRRLRRKKKANPASLRSAAPSKGRGSRGHSLLPLEGGALKGRRLDGDTAIPDIKPSPRGEGCETRTPLFSTQRLSPMGKAKRKRLRRKKRKPTPPRCARQPLPREGARVDTPSFLWKEVPRRGGGWMGKAV